MSVTKEDVLAALARVGLPGGDTLVGQDMIRAVTVHEGAVSFVIEAPSPEAAAKMEGVRQAAEAVVQEVPGVAKVSALLTAHGPAAAKAPPPNLKIGGHPKPQEGPTKPAGVQRILAIGSGKGGVGKSTVSSNLAVALAKQGRKVGLLDADIYGPSQPRMMGISGRPSSPDGKILRPMENYGVKCMSMGLFIDHR